MRSTWAVMFVCLSTINASSEEAYQRTNNALGTCIGEQMRPLVKPGSPVRSPQAIDELLKQTCGHLEEKAEREFFEYLGARVGRRQTDAEQAEMMMSIIAQMKISHTRGGMRRTMVEAYSTAIKRK
jgi:hypothetical protein